MWKKPRHGIHMHCCNHIWGMHMWTLAWSSAAAFTYPRIFVRRCNMVVLVSRDNRRLKCFKDHNHWNGGSVVGGSWFWSHWECQKQRGQSAWERSACKRQAKHRLCRKSTEVTPFTDTRYSIVLYSGSTPSPVASSTASRPISAITKWGCVRNLSSPEMVASVFASLPHTD